MRRLRPRRTADLRFIHPTPHATRTHRKHIGTDIFCVRISRALLEFRVKVIARAQTHDPSRVTRAYT